MYTFDDMRSDINEARKLDRERGDRARSFEREMKGNFQQNAARSRQLQGTWRDRALEERALRGTFDQDAALRREMEGPWDARNKAENWRANLTSNTQIRGQDLAAQTARYGTDSQMIEGAAQRSFMDRIYRMQDETQKGSHESLGKDRRLKIYSDAWLNLQDDAFKAFPEDEVKRDQYIQQGRRQLDQLFPEFGKPKPPLPGGLEFGGGGLGDEPGAKTPSRAPYNGGRTVNSGQNPPASRPSGSPWESEDFRTRMRQAYQAGDPYWKMGGSEPADPYGLNASRNTPGPVMRRQGQADIQPSMDALTRRTLQMYDLPQSNATDNAMNVLNGGQRPMRKPDPKQGYQGFNGWEDVRRRTGGF